MHKIGRTCLPYDVSFSVSSVVYSEWESFLCESVVRIRPLLLVIGFLIASYTTRCYYGKVDYDQSQTSFESTSRCHSKGVLTEHQ